MNRLEEKEMEGKDELKSERIEEKEIDVENEVKQIDVEPVKLDVPNEEETDNVPKEIETGKETLVYITDYIETERVPMLENDGETEEVLVLVNITDAFETGRVPLLADVSETEEVLVPEDVNKMSKEIKNVPENSIGELLKNFQEENVDKILEVAEKYQVMELGESEKVEESKSEVSFDAEDSDLEND